MIGSLIPQERAESVADSIATGKAARQLLISGVPGAGKSSLLRELVRTLARRNLKPILVVPPKKAYDTASVAMLQLGIGLNEHGYLNGNMEMLLEADRPWNEKAELVSQAIRRAKEAVVLCDEPEQWPIDARSANPAFCPFTYGHVRDLQSRIFKQFECRVVYTGRWNDSEHYALPKYTGFADPTAFGLFADVYSELQAQLGEPLAGVTWLEARLLTAIAVVTSPRDVAAAWDTWTDAWALVSEFLTKVSAQSNWQSLPGALRKLSLLRGEFDDKAIDDLCGDETTPAVRDLLTNVLLTRTQKGFTLSRFIREHRQLKTVADEMDSQAVHGRIADLVADSIGKVSRLEEVTVRVEGFYHAAASGAVDAAVRFRLFFVDQLHLLGKTLSHECHNYTAAVDVFRTAIRLAPENDYGHHYLAYNLDMLADSEEEIDEEYAKATELNRAHPWYWSRRINFLITIGEAGNARSVWRDAIASLEPVTTESIYFSLHQPVANLLLQRAQLDFARQILEEVDPELIDTDRHFRALWNFLAALEEASAADSVFPLKIAPDDWWTSRPHLDFPVRLEAGPAFQYWIPGRIESVDDDNVYLVVASRPEAGEPPEYMDLTLSRNEFDEASLDEPSSQIGEDRFLEVGYYERDVIRIRIHSDDPWDDLPPLDPPDPFRYLRKAGWVQ